MLVLDKQHEVIGYLFPIDKGYMVLCPGCATRDDKLQTPIYHANIGDYWQHCFSCRMLLHVGKTDACPELFDGKE